jgi:hypothetical protein
MAEPLTQAEIAAIAERADKATAGPWVHEDVVGFRDTHIRNPNGLGVLFTVPEFANRSTANAAFVCAMREDVPRLLATIAERDADIARLLAAIDAANVVGEATNKVLRKLERLIRERGGEG